MKYYYLYKKLDDEVCGDLINFLNDNEDNEVTVILNSDGGHVLSAQQILHTLNDRVFRGKSTKLIASGRISSCAFDLFFNFIGSREILFITNGLYHYSGADFKITENGKLEYYDQEFELKQLKKLKPITEKWCLDLGFNEKEMRRLKQNKDIYFTYERLCELLYRPGARVNQTKHGTYEAASTYVIK